MGDYARRALWPRGVAVRAGPRRTARAKTVRRKTTLARLVPRMEPWARLRAAIARRRRASSPFRTRSGELSISGARTPTSDVTLRSIGLHLGPSSAAEQWHGVKRRRAFANLEMQLGRVDIAGLAGFADDLSALDHLAALDQEFLGVSIGGDVTIRMANEHEVAITLELVAGVGHDAILGRFDRRALG